MPEAILNRLLFPATCAGVALSFSKATHFRVLFANHLKNHAHISFHLTIMHYFAWLAQIITIKTYLILLQCDKVKQSDWLNHPHPFNCGEMDLPPLVEGSLHVG